jgi:hypothetical protein
MLPRAKPLLHPHDQNFLKEIKRTILNTTIVLAISIAGALIAFYFNTKSTLEYHEKSIIELQKKIDFLIEIHCKKD